MTAVEPEPVEDRHLTAPGGRPCGRSVVSGETWRRAQPQTSSPPHARTQGTRCSGWSRVCGGDHRQGPRGHWGSDSSFLSLPEQTRAQPCSRALSQDVTSFPCPHGDKSKALCTVTNPGFTGCAHRSGAAEATSLPAIFGSVFMGVPGKGGAGSPVTPLWLSTSHVTWFVSR